MTVLQVCAYGADYPGNFVASLTALEKALHEKGIQTIYAFVERARDKDWCREICRRTKVYFLPEAKARILPKTYQIFRSIYRENDIGIVHSHFELYDMPATLTAPKGTRVFWHLHDPIDPGRGLRRILWKLQYGVVSKGAYLISVADHYRDAVIKMGFPENQTTTILNAINLDRIQLCPGAKEKTFDFLTFGWDFFRKGDDLILKACDRLEEEGYQFRLLLNGNEKTWPKLNEYMGQRTPRYLTTGDPVENINELFAVSAVFLQASRRETFSYAVCEAAYAGLPVISSDIPGLEWAHSLPTVEFFETENWEQLYQMMKNRLNQESNDVESVAYTREIIEGRYSLRVWVENVMKCYGI